MLNCQKITELVSLSQEQKLTLKQYMEVKIHLMLCPHCKAFKQNCQQIDKLMREFRS
ncbi:MAG: zf-HC2 domain-containing protein [Lonepinella koalarum]|nr:zf-HC2 domain-containing protein [Lonepinella koalarum]